MIRTIISRSSYLATMLTQKSKITSEDVHWQY